MSPPYRPSMLPPGTTTHELNRLQSQLYSLETALQTYRGKVKVAGQLAHASACHDHADMDDLTLYLHVDRLLSDLDRLASRYALDIGQSVTKGGDTDE